MDEERFEKIAKHTIGLDQEKPYTRHGKKYYKPYRNYFVDYKNGLFESACESGYAYKYAKYKEDGNDLFMYALTPKGMDWLGKRLGIQIIEF